MNPERRARWLVTPGPSVGPGSVTLLVRLATALGIGLILGVTLLACGAPMDLPGRGDQQQTPGSGHFADGEVAFDYPSTWYAATFPVVSSFFTTQVFLSTAPLSDPCDRTSNSVSCERLAVSRIEADGVYVTWMHWGFPGTTFDPAGGEPGTVGERRATLEWSSPSSECAGIGGERELLVTIESPSEWNWTEVRACLRGPDFGLREGQIEAMLASAEWAS